MPRRSQLTIIAIIFASLFVGFTFVSFFKDQPEGTRHPSYDSHNVPYGSQAIEQEPIVVVDSILRGDATAPKLENATLKAELGHASWKLLHTMMAKFPDEPTEEDSSALKSYIHLFARLYPCGDCARHFQKILAKFPPQVATRSTAAAWACHVHNEVNKRLKKELFDCSNIGDFYDCGCAGNDSVEGEGKEKAKSVPALKLEKEGLTKGG